MTHTPGKLKATAYSSTVGCSIIVQPDPEKNTISIAMTLGAMADDPADFRAEIEANAQRFVLCWNTHDGLLEALEQAAMELEEAAKILNRSMPSTAGIFRTAASQARAAIAKAKEK